MSWCFSAASHRFYQQLTWENEAYDKMTATEPLVLTCVQYNCYCMSSFVSFSLQLFFRWIVFLLPFVLPRILFGLCTFWLWIQHEIQCCNRSHKCMQLVELVFNTLPATTLRLEMCFCDRRRFPPFRSWARRLPSNSVDIWCTFLMASRYSSILLLLVQLFGGRCKVPTVHEEKVQKEPLKTAITH